LLWALHLGIAVTFRLGMSAQLIKQKQIHNALFAKTLNVIGEVEFFTYFFYRENCFAEWQWPIVM